MIARHYLFSQHVRDDLYGMHAPLLLPLSTGNVEDQLVHATHIQGPQDLVMDAGVVIGSLYKYLYKEKEKKINTCNLLIQIQF